jgi:hypothetical protein
VRAANQRCDGEYEVSASKVMAAKTADVIKALTDKRARARRLQAGVPWLSIRTEYIPRS